MEGAQVRRRLVQSTLFPHKESSIQESENGNREAEMEEGKHEEEEGEDANGRKQRRQSKKKGNSRSKTTPPASSTKVTENGKETSDNQVEESNAPVISKPNFFLKTSERRQQKRQQNQRIVTEALEENDEICSPPCSTTNGRSTPQKQKRQYNSTPRKGKSTPSKKLKNSTSDLCRQIPFDLAVGELHMQPIPDLRLEAKLTAEENSRIFAGRQIHPFFTWRKGGKTNQDSTDSESRPCFDRKEKGISFNPIHIFENIEDDCMTIDWGNWIFSERSGHESLECGYPPVYDGSVGSLNFDNFLKASYLAQTSAGNNCDQCSTPQKEGSMSCPDQPEFACPLSYSSSTGKGVTCVEQLDLVLLLKDTEDLLPRSVDLEVQEYNLEKSDCSAGISRDENSATEFQDELLQERIMSNYHTCHSQPENCLWTDKYQPQSAKQICGNSESVKLLSEWLHLWHEKGSLNSRSCIDQEKSNIQHTDHDYQLSDYDSDDVDDEESLKNVLLVTGPVGIGKSAAIYACARDEGFQIIEINASDWRNGPLIKQKFGEAVESHWRQRPVEKVTDPDKSISKFFTSEKSNKHRSNGEVIELIHLSDKEDSEDACDLPGATVTADNTNASYKHNIKTLILFEDVDVNVDEDHGFLNTVQQLSETAKRPIILTSNSVNPVLPKNLDRSQLSFSEPSLEELLDLVNMIFAAEKTKIHPCLAKRFIDHCRGDIRKTIMLLQFWCQGKKIGEANKLQPAYSSALFDVEAAHEVLPMLIPFGFPSQLSEAVNEEVVKSLMLMEETQFMVHKTKGENIDDNRPESIHEQDDEPESVKAKKEAMLNLHCPLQDEVECARFNAESELSDSSGSPVAFARKRRNVNAVLSSDSEDDAPGGCTTSLVSAEILDFDSEVLDLNRLPNSHCLSTEICDYPIEQLYHAEGLRLDDNCCPFTETIDDSRGDDICQSQNMSFVPESSFIPETEIMNERELYSTAVSYGDVFYAIGCDIPCQNHYSTPNLKPPIGPESNNSLSILQNYQEMLENNYNASTSGFCEEEIGDSVMKAEADIAGGCTMLDECSRVDVTVRLMSFGDPEANHEIDYAQETWNRLHNQCGDLRKYVTEEEKFACQVLNGTHGTSHLISDADLLLKDCQALLFDYLESAMIPSEKIHSYSFDDNQSEMSSILAQHGICFYAKEIASLGSTAGCRSSLDLGSKMITSSGSSIALGKLVFLDQSNVEKSDTFTPKSSNFFTRKLDSSACDVLQSVVPFKSYLAVKGGASHEYLSALSQISRFESTRLSEYIDKRKQRRGRVAKHYLSSGSLAMSSEEISLLGECNNYQSSRKE